MSVIAATDLGALAGEAGEGMARFRGVHYALPPTGERRFAPPAPMPPWEGIRDATRHGPVAPQPPSRLRAAMGDFERPQGEDCLTMTIATPAADDKARPVIVWLHGGAYMTGAGSLDWYDGGVLARDGDCVVVGVNYRLGALGFLNHPALDGGNWALQDMIAALAWVRDNISAFGGDPENVTVMGQSAGGHAIMCLLTMPAAENLFHRAILQSPPPVLLPLSTAIANATADRLLDALEIPANAPDIVGLLREAPLSRVLAAQMGIVRASARFADVSPPFVPSFDGFAGKDSFVAAAARGALARNIDIIVGTTREEMHGFFAPDPDMADPPAAAVAERFRALSGRTDSIDSYRLRRPGGRVTDLLADLVTDHSFLFPSLALAEAVAAGGGRAWAYQFDWAPPASKFRACHCIELPFVFGNPEVWPDSPMLAGGDFGQIAALSAVLRAAWTGFSRAGNPSVSGLRWPVYGAETRTTMVYGAITGPVGDPAGIFSRGGFLP